MQNVNASEDTRERGFWESRLMRPMRRPSGLRRGYKVNVAIHTFDYLCMYFLLEMDVFWAGLRVMVCESLIA